MAKLLPIQYEPPVQSNSDNAPKTITILTPKRKVSSTSQNPITHVTSSTSQNPITHVTSSTSQNPITHVTSSTSQNPITHVTSSSTSQNLNTNKKKKIQDETKAKKRFKMTKGEKKSAKKDALMAIEHQNAKINKFFNEISKKLKDKNYDGVADQLENTMKNEEKFAKKIDVRAYLAFLHVLSGELGKIKSKEKSLKELQKYVKECVKDYEKLINRIDNLDQKKLLQKEKEESLQDDLDKAKGIEEKIVYIRTNKEADEIFEEFIKNQDARRKEVSDPRKNFRKEIIKKEKKKYFFGFAKVKK